MKTQLLHVTLQILLSRLQWTSSGTERQQPRAEHQVCTGGVWTPARPKSKLVMPQG